MQPMLQMQLLQQQMMGGGMGCFDGFEDEMYDMMDPSLLYWLDGYGHGFGNGQVHGQMNGFDQASQYYQLMQMAQRMQMMQYPGHGMMRHPRRRAKMHLARMRMLNGGMGMRGMVGGGVGVGGFAGFGGRALMGSPFGMDAARGNQLALMGSPWGGG